MGLISLFSGKKGSKQITKRSSSSVHKSKPANQTHRLKADKYKKKAIQARKDKRYDDSFIADAFAFHEMRLFEVDIYESEVGFLRECLELGSINRTEFSSGKEKAKKFLESWSDSSAALRLTGTAMNKLGVPKAKQRKIAEELSDWSAHGGFAFGLNRILSKAKGEQ